VRLPALSRKIGIDLGTSAARIYVKGEGVVVNEPSGASTLPGLIGKANGRPRIFRPDVVVSVPSGVSSHERRAVTEAAMSAGARQVWLIDEALAAAMGAGLPIDEVRASAICELGAATTEVAVLSHSGTAAARSLAVGGRTLDAAIAGRFGITEREAEEVKIAVGSAVRLEQPLVTSVRDVELSSNDIADAIAEPLRRIASTVSEVIRELPGRAAAEIRERGIVLSGGGAQLRGLSRYITDMTGIRAVVADEPQTSVVRGTGVALDTFEVLKRNQTYLR
jgi:rod shape-determining protein MreB